VELHLHLEGAVRLSTIADLCEQLDITVPNNNHPNLDGHRQMFCITERVQDLGVFLSKMWNVQSLFRNEEIITRVAFECCEDAYLNGVRLLELRFSPTFMMQSVNNDHSHLTIDSIHHAVLAGVRKAESTFDMAIGLIAILDRSRPLEAESAVFDCVMNYRDDYCGIDIANDESYSCVKFQSIYHRAQHVNLGLTCHAGESTNAANVRLTIEALQVNRVGHGYLAANDPEVLQLVLDKGILLEICPISNIRVNSALLSSIADHPVRKLLDAGVKLCINTDDPGMFDSNIVDEYELLVKHHKFTAKEFHLCNLNALDASFLPSAKIDRIRQKYFSHHY
jgi:adenosine deaminase